MGRNGGSILLRVLRECSVTVISACWATVDWYWPKEWNKCAQANLHFKKKKKRKKVQAGNEWLNILPKSSHMRKKPPPEPPPLNVFKSSWKWWVVLGQGFISMKIWRDRFFREKKVSFKEEEVEAFIRQERWKIKMNLGRAFHQQRKTWRTTKAISGKASVEMKN